MGAGLVTSTTVEIMRTVGLFSERLREFISFTGLEALR